MDLFHNTMQRVRVKVCCISSVDEARMALDAGADAIGLVSAMPSGPGVISDDDIQTIAQWVGPATATVLLTSRQTAVGISEQVRRVHPSIVQLCDTMEPSEIMLLQTLHSDVRFMPVVHVRDLRAVEESVRLSATADAILLDSGNPEGRVKELGGTGRIHDWKLSRAIRDAVAVPVFLAGGLTATNVATAIHSVQPFGVDVCSGVRRAGKLDAVAVRAFVQAARAVH